MWVALAVLLVATAGVLLHEGRSMNFWFDEWIWLLERREWDAATFLEPHNGHFSLVPVAIYKLMFALAGADDYAAYRLLAIAVHLMVVGLVFVYVGRRAGAVLGLLAVAILVANNLRDIPTDAAAGRRTLAVRLGDARTRLLYRWCVVGAFATIVLGVAADIVDDRIGLPQWGLLGLVGWILAIRPMELVGTAEGTALVPVLTGTAAVHAATGLLLALGFVLERTA